MRFGETVAVYCETRTEHTDTLCGQGPEFLYVEADGAHTVSSFLQFPLPLPFILHLCSGAVTTALPRGAAHTPTRPSPSACMIGELLLYFVVNKAECLAPALFLGMPN
jgi:hypothetical protein